MKLTVEDAADKLAQNDIDGMDLKTLVQIVYELQEEFYRQLTDIDLIETFQQQMDEELEIILKDL